MREYKKFHVKSGDVQKELANALEFIRVTLEKMKLGTKEANHAQLMAEEVLVRLVEKGNFENGGTIQISIRRFLGRVTLSLTVPGREFDFVSSIALNDNDEEISPDTSAAIQNILLRSFSDKLRYRHRRGYNNISITALKSSFASLYWTMGALIFAIIMGLILKNFASPVICENLNEKFLVPVRDIFMNCLKLCSVPVIFLSIASCTAQFKDLSEIKRIGIKLLMCFAFMQFISASVGIGLFSIFPKPENVIKIAAASSVVSNTASFSIIDTIVNLMPSNIIKPFLEGNMLQLIVLAIFIGAAVENAGANTIRTFLEESNMIFMKITGGLMRFIPLVVFCSITSFFITTGSATLLSLLGLVIMTFTGYAVLLLIFYILTALLCRLNPAHLFSKSMPMMITALSTSSSLAAIPDSMRSAEKMGISPKIYSLSIPLGFSINKNALCMYVAAATLFTAKLYGIEVHGSDLFFLLFSVVVLVIGSPSVSGAVIIVFSILLSQLNVPIEAISILMGINPFFDMFETPVNCFGTMTSTLIVASRCGMLDEKVYNNRVNNNATLDKMK